MIVTNEKRLDGDNNLVSGQGGATNGSGDQKYGLAQISGLWQGIGVSSQSSNCYALPGIRPRFSFETVEAKSLRQSRLHAEPEIDLSQTIADTAANKSDEVVLKSTDSHTPKAEPLSTDEIIKEALQDYFYFEDPDGEQGEREEKRQQVMQTVFDLMRAHGTNFTFLPVEADHTKPYIKIPQKSYIEEIFSFAKIAGDSNFSKVNCRLDEYDLSIKQLDMFDKKSVFWGVVNTKVEKKKGVNSSSKNPIEKKQLGIFRKLFQSHCVDSRRNDAPAVSEMQSAELRADERVVREMPFGVGVMTYAKPQGSLVHIGRFDGEGRLHGKGIVRVPGLGVFHGNFRDGYPHGYGSLYYDNGDIYEGNYDHGVGYGKAVFTTNEGRQTQSEDTLQGIFRHSTTTELDPNSVHNNGPDIGEQQKKKTEHNLDGTIDITSVGGVPGFSYRDDDVYHKQRVDGGYLTYKEDDRKRGSYQIYRLTSPAGRVECQYPYKKRIYLRKIILNGGASDNIDRGGDLSGKKKK